MLWGVGLVETRRAVIYLEATRGAGFEFYHFQPRLRDIFIGMRERGGVHLKGFLLGCEAFAMAAGVNPREFEPGNEGAELDPRIFVPFAEALEVFFAEDEEAVRGGDVEALGEEAGSREPRVQKALLE